MTRAGKGRLDKDPRLAAALRSVFEGLVARGEQSDSDWQLKWRSLVKEKSISGGLGGPVGKRKAPPRKADKKTLSRVLGLEQTSSGNYPRILSGGVALSVAQLVSTLDVLLHFKYMPNKPDPLPVGVAEWSELLEGAASRIQAEIAAFLQTRKVYVAVKRTPRVGIPPRIVGFQGRAEELGEIRVTLEAMPDGDGNPVRRVAISGMGGLGKSSLALEYVYVHDVDYDIVWWCSAQSRAVLVSDLARLDFALSEDGEIEADVERAAAAALVRLSQRPERILLVYDNVENPAEIQNLFPPENVRLIVTSRVSDWTEWFSHIPLRLLSRDEATRYLQERVPAASDPEDAALLADALEYLPLALDHAAATCRRTKLGFYEYTTALESLIQTAPRGSRYEKSVFATFRLAIDEIAAEVPFASLIVRFFAHCDSELVPAKLVESAFPTAETRIPALAPLLDVSLLRAETFIDGTPAFRMHRLVAAVVNSLPEQYGMFEEMRRAFGEAALSAVAIALDECFPSNPRSPSSWSECERLAPHFLKIYTKTACAPWLYLRFGQYLAGRSYHDAARMWFEMALNLIEKVPDLPQEILLDYIWGLAGASVDLSDHPRAFALYERAIDIALASSGSNSLNAAMAMDYAAQFLRKEGHERSLGYFKIAVQILEGLPDPESNLYFASVLARTADAYRYEGELGEARKCLDQAIQVFERGGGDHQQGFALRKARGHLLLAEGKCAEACECFKSIVDSIEGSFGAGHGSMAGALTDYAGALEADLKPDEALSCQWRALEVAIDVYGRDNVECLFQILPLGRHLVGREDFDQAIEVYELGFEVVRNAGEIHTTNFIYLKIDFASVMQLIGEKDEALRHWSEALEITDQWQVEENDEKTGIRTMIGVGLFRAGHHPISEEIFRSVRDYHLRMKGPDDEVTHFAARNLARACFAVGKRDEAYDLAVAALTGLEKILGVSHVKTKLAAQAAVEAMKGVERAAEADAVAEKFQLTS